MKKRGMIVIVLIVVFVLILAVVLFFLMRGVGRSSSEENETTQNLSSDSVVDNSINGTDLGNNTSGNGTNGTDIVAIGDCSGNYIDKSGVWECEDINDYAFCYDSSCEWYCQGTFDCSDLDENRCELYEDRDSACSWNSTTKFCNGAVNDTDCGIFEREFGYWKFECDEVSSCSASSAGCEGPDGGNCTDFVSGGTYVVGNGGGLKEVCSSVMTCGSYKNTTDFVGCGLQKDCDVLSKSVCETESSCNWTG